MENRQVKQKPKTQTSNNCSIIVIINISIIYVSGYTGWP